MVAEALGAAVLTVSVDDRQLRSGLLAVQNEAQRTAQQVQAAFARLGGEIRLPNLQNLSARIAVDSSQLDRSLQTAEQLRRVLDEISQQRVPGAGGAGGLGPKPPLPPPIPPDLLRGLAEARQRSEGLAEAAQRQGEALQRSGAAARIAGLDMGFLTGALGQLGLATSALGVATFVGNQIKQLDEASARVRTLGVDSDELKKRLGDLSLELKNNVSQLELLQASYDVVSSGFSKTADVQDILRASALGAAGGGAKLEDVARGLAGVLNAYGLSTSEATRIVDQFAQTQNDGVITIREYVNEIGNVASIAAAAGIPLEELNAIIATATLKSVPVQQTFTGLRQAISSVLNPSEKAASTARALGIDMSITAVKSKGFIKLLEDIEAKGGGSADKLMALLGSVEAQAVIQPQLNDKLATTNRLLQNQADVADVAGKSADINSKTISGGIKRIGNSFSNLAVTLETAVSPYLQSVLDDIESIISKLTVLGRLLPLDQLGKLGGEAGKYGSDIALRQLLGPAYDFVIADKYLGPKGQPKAEAATKPAPKPPPKVEPKPEPKPDEPVVDKAKQAADIAEIRTKNDLELKGIQVRIAAARQLERLDGLDKQRLESELALNEKILAVKTIQADIQRELAKPVGNGITNIEGSRSAVRLEQLQGQQRKAVLELRQAYEQAGRDLVRAAREAAAVSRRTLDVFRSGGDTLQELGRRGADAITGARSPIDVRSPEDALREGRRRVAAQVQDLGNGISDAARDAVRAAEALRDANQRRAGGELIPLDQLAKFKTDADSAAAKLTIAGLDVGRALKDGATEAAKQLRDAQAGLNDVIRGGFEFFTSGFQQEQLALARREFQPLIERGVFRRDVPTQTPEQIFGLASLARQFLQAENQVALARAQKDAADAALRNAGALVENSTKMGLLSDSLIKLATKEWMVNVNVQPPMAALPGV